MAIIDNNEKLITDAVRKLDMKISLLISRLNIKSGRITSDAINLKKAISMRKEIAKEFGKYKIVINRATDFAPVLKQVDSILKEAGIANVISRADKSIITTLSLDSFNQMAALSDQYAFSISSKIYSSVIVGDSIEDLTLGVRQSLVGGVDKAGRPMAAHAKTIATTGYREADSVLMKAKAEEFEIEKFEYAGSLIKDSRKWCQDHVDKIYTLEEISEWGDRSWQGKKDGDPFVTRGGWNCRHSWLPVVE